MCVEKPWFLLMRKMIYKTVGFPHLHSFAGWPSSIYLLMKAAREPWMTFLYPPSNFSYEMGRTWATVQIASQHFFVQSGGVVPPIL